MAACYICDATVRRKHTCTLCMDILKSQRKLARAKNNWRRKRQIFDNKCKGCFSTVHDTLDYCNLCETLFYCQEQNKTPPIYFNKKPIGYEKLCPNINVFAPYYGDFFDGAPWRRPTF